MQEAIAREFYRRVYLSLCSIATYYKLWASTSARQSGHWKMQSFIKHHYLTYVYAKHNHACYTSSSWIYYQMLSQRHQTEQVKINQMQLAWSMITGLLVGHGMPNTGSKGVNVQWNPHPWKVDTHDITDNSESPENAAMLYSIAGLRCTTPAGNIPEARTPRYNRQNVGSQWCPL